MHRVGPHSSLSIREFWRVELQGHTASCAPTCLLPSSECVACLLIPLPRLAWTHTCVFFASPQPSSRHNGVVRVQVLPVANASDDRDDPLGGGKKKGRKTGEPCRTRLESRATWGNAGRTRKNRRKELGVMVMSCWRATVATVRTSPPPLSLGMFLSVSTGATDPEHSVLCPYYLGSSAGKELR